MYYREPWSSHTLTFPPHLAPACQWYCIAHHIMDDFNSVNWGSRKRHLARDWWRQSMGKAMCGSRVRYMALEAISKLRCLPYKLHVFHFHDSLCQLAARARTVIYKCKDTMSRCQPGSAKYMSACLRMADHVSTDTIVLITWLCRFACHSFMKPCTGLWCPPNNCHTHVRVCCSISFQLSYILL